MDFTKWKTKDNVYLDIENMTDLYIENCIRFCQNGLNHYNSLLPDYFEELPEPQNTYGWFGLYAREYIKVFKQELRKRKNKRRFNNE